DAQGNLIVENVETAPAGSGLANSANSNSANSGGNTNSQNKNANTDGGKVTRNVKGKKEVVLQLAQLQGKGYPAPVAFNAGK
ncbi:MAG TPA: hypothetical protein VGD05_02565, partial [Pyrinomonadaceae bacterium]